jgi:hypothetical protein
MGMFGKRAKSVKTCSGMCVDENDRVGLRRRSGDDRRGTEGTVEVPCTTTPRADAIIRLIICSIPPYSSKLLTPVRLAILAIKSRIAC